MSATTVTLLLSSIMTDSEARSSSSASTHGHTRRSPARAPSCITFRRNFFWTEGKANTDWHFPSYLFRIKVQFLQILKKINNNNCTRINKWTTKMWIETIFNIVYDRILIRIQINNFNKNTKNTNHGSLFKIQSIWELGLFWKIRDTVQFLVQCCSTNFKITYETFYIHTIYTIFYISYIILVGPLDLFHWTSKNTLGLVIILFTTIMSYVEIFPPLSRPKSLLEKCRLPQVFPFWFQLFRF